MEAEQQKGMPTKWMLNIIFIAGAVAAVNSIFLSDCLLSKLSSDIAGTFFVQSGFICILIFWIVVREYNYTVIDDDRTKRLSHTMMACYLICIFIFGGALSWVVVESVLDIAILWTSHTFVQFNVIVSEVDTIPSTGRGGCRGVKYTFYNAPIKQNTTICDMQGSFNFLKKNDALLIKENVGLFGALILSEEYAPKQQPS